MPTSQQLLTAQPDSLLIDGTGEIVTAALKDDDVIGVLWRRPPGWFASAFGRFECSASVCKALAWIIDINKAILLGPKYSGVCLTDETGNGDFFSVYQDGNFLAYVMQCSEHWITTLGRDEESYLEYPSLDAAVAAIVAIRGA